MKTIRKNEQGIAHLLIIVLVVVVVVVVGFVGWKLMKNKSLTGTVADKVASTQASAACKQLYNDNDLCKFTASYNGKAPFKATFSSTDKDGKTSDMEIQQDGKDNSSMVVKEGGTETAAFVTLNGDSYLKNETDGTWFKYPKSTSTTNTTAPTSDLKIDNADSEATKPEAQRITYKKLGTEKCGNTTCFKYQVVDPSLTDVKESIIWFGTKDYQLHKWSVSNTDGSSNVGEFTYTNVTISAPSPVTEAPGAGSVPTIPDVTQ